MPKLEKKEKFYKKPRRKIFKQKEFRKRSADIAFLSKFKAKLRSKKKIPLESRRLIRCAKLTSNSSLVFFYLYIFLFFKLVMMERNKFFALQDPVRSSPLGYNVLTQSPKLVPPPFLKKITKYVENFKMISSFSQKQRLILKKVRA